MSLKSHPDPEILAAFAEGRLEEEKRAEIEAHLGACEDCFELFMAASDFLAEQPDSDPGRVVPLRPRRGLMNPTVLLSAAAAAVIAVSISLWLVKRGPDEEAIRQQLLNHNADLAKILSSTDQRTVDLAAAYPVDLMKSAVPEIKAYRGGDEATAKIPDMEALIEELESLTKKNPKSIPSWRYLVSLCLIGNDFDSAYLNAHDAVAHHPDDILLQALFSTATYYAEIDKEKAWQDLRDLNRRHPDNPLILYNLGAIYRREGNIQESDEAWQRFHQIAPADHPLRKWVEGYLPAEDEPK